MGCQVSQLVPPDEAAGSSATKGGVVAPVQRASHESGRPSYTRISFASESPDQAMARVSTELDRKLQGERLLVELSREAEDLARGFRALSSVSSFRPSDLAMHCTRPLTIMAYVLLRRPLEKLGVPLTNMPKFLILIGNAHTTTVADVAVTFQRVEVLQFLYTQTYAEGGGLLSSLCARHPLHAVAMVLAVLGSDRKPPGWDDGTHRNFVSRTDQLFEHRFLAELPSPMRGQLRELTARAIEATNPDNLANLLRAWSLSADVSPLEKHPPADYCRGDDSRVELMQTTLAVCYMSHIFRDAKYHAAWMKVLLTRLQSCAEVGRADFPFRAEDASEPRFLAAQAWFLRNVAQPFVRRWVHMVTGSDMPMPLTRLPIALAETYEAMAEEAAKRNSKSVDGGSRTHRDDDRASANIDDGVRGGDGRHRHHSFSSNGTRAKSLDVLPGSEAIPPRSFRTAPAGMKLLQLANVNNNPLLSSGEYADEYLLHDVVALRAICRLYAVEFLAVDDDSQDNHTSPAATKDLPWMQ